MHKDNNSPTNQNLMNEDSLYNCTMCNQEYPPMIDLHTLRPEKSEDDDHLQSLEERLHKDQECITSNLSTLKAQKFKLDFNYQMLHNQGHNYCCVFYANTIQLMKDVFTKYKVTSSFLSIFSRTLWDIPYTEIDQLASIGRSKNMIAEKCFVLIIAILLIYAPIIYILGVLAWASAKIGLWYTNRSAYYQMSAPISQSTPHLNWSSFAFLLLAIPFVVALSIFLAVGIKALYRKKPVEIN